MLKANPQPFWDLRRDYMATGKSRAFHLGFDIWKGHTRALQPITQAKWFFPTSLVYIPGMLAAFVLVFGAGYSLKFMKWATGREWRDSWEKTYNNLYMYKWPSSWKTEDDLPWTIKYKPTPKDQQEK